MSKKDVTLDKVLGDKNKLEEGMKKALMRGRF